MRSQCVEQAWVSTSTGEGVVPSGEIYTDAHARLRRGHEGRCEPLCQLPGQARTAHLPCAPACVSRAFSARGSVRMDPEWLSQDISGFPGIITTCAQILT